MGGLTKVDIVSALFNIAFFILLFYLISWFARKMKKLDEQLDLIEKKIDSLSKKDS